MSAVITALYADHQTASDVRTRLVTDGFPTDRVELTSRDDPGQASLSPRGSMHEKLYEYFAQLFQADGNKSAERLTQAVIDGHAVIALHPRGDVETSRAREILAAARPVEVREFDMANQVLEHAAGSSEAPLIRNPLLEPEAKPTKGRVANDEQR